MVAKKRKAPQSQQPTLRHLWLASLGLAVVARREAVALPGRVRTGAAQWQQEASVRLSDACHEVKDGVASARAQVQPKVVKLSSAVEQRLAPVLVKFGLKPAQKKPARKARKVAKKATRQSSARKAAPARAKASRRAA